jgi:hypothetical protein
MQAPARVHGDLPAPLPQDEGAVEEATPQAPPAATGRKASKPSAKASPRKKR